MGDATETYVGLPADGVGSKVRNLTLDVVQPDGTTKTVLMQVVSIADENGKQYRIGSGMPTADDETHQLLLKVIGLLGLLLTKLEE